jgi:hypothetical protein
MLYASVLKCGEMLATIGEKVLKPCSDFVFAFSVFCFPGALDNEVSGENVGQ